MIKHSAVRELLAALPASAARGGTATRRVGRRARAADDSENLVLAHDQQLFAVEPDLGTAVLAEQDAVARLNIHRLARAVFPVFAFADGDHFALLRLLLRRVGDDDAAAHLLAFLDALHNNAVVQGFDVRRHNLLRSPFSVFLPNYKMVSWRASFMKD